MWPRRADFPFGAGSSLVARLPGLGCLDQFSPLSDILAAFGSRGFHGLAAFDMEGDINNKRDLPLSQQTRQMGTRTKDRTPTQAHNYVVQRESAKLLRKFKGLNPSSDEARLKVGETLRYYDQMIIDNPMTLNARSGAAMWTRIGKYENAGQLGDWWFEEIQRGILGRIGRCVHHQAYRLRPQETANTIWGMGMLGPRLLTLPLPSRGDMGDVVHDLIQRGCRELEKIRPIDMTSMVEGLARMRYPRMEWVMSLVTRETKQRMVKFKDPDLPRMLWALANLGWHDNDGLLSAIACECKKRIGLFTPKDLSMLLWGFAVLGFKDIQHMLWVSVVQGVCRWRWGFEPHYAVKFLWAYDRLEHHPGHEAMRKFSNNLAAGLHELHTSDIAVAMRSLVNLGFPNDAVIVKLNKLLRESHFLDIPARDAATLMWAMAMVDRLERDIFMILRRSIVQARTETNLPESHRLDLYRCILHLSVYRPVLAKLMPVKLLEECQKTWIDMQLKEEIPEFIDDIKEKLQEMEFKVKETDAICQGTIFTTSAEAKDGSQYAVEVLLPPKCYRNLKGEVTGSQLWKEKIMESWGYKVLRLDAGKWDEFGDDNTGKTEYLNQILAEANK
ncbi:hypothetical protein BSKO_10473 [Bryopsis sp. KO-2023]|nr:hypothetical protein BSKO_10473 [Bryopsis sp. KO-2023]